MNGICFDFNGVIVDDERHHCTALRTVLAEWGITVTDAAYYRDYLGFDDRGCFMYAWSTKGWTLDTARLELLMRAKGEQYCELIAADMTLVPGVTEFIRAAHADGIRMVVVTAALRSEVEYVLTTAQLSEYFLGIVAAEDVTATKPDPQGYRKGHAILGLPTDRCLVIEDSVPGARAGRAAGMPVLMVATSHTRDELAHVDAAGIWDDFRGHAPRDLPW